MKLTEAAYLAGIPVVGTAVAYLFEAGFASFHGIPISLIQLSISQLVGTGVLGLLGLWMLHTYFATGIAFLARREHLLFKFVGLGMLYAALPLLLIAGLGANDAKGWVGVALFFFMPSVVGLVEALTMEDKSKSFTQRWWGKASASFDSTPQQADGLDDLIDTPQNLFLASLLVIFLAFSLGHRYASLATPSLVLKSDPAKALVVVYGDRWFFRSSEDVGKPRSQAPIELYVRTGDSVGEVVLRDSQKPKVSASKL